MGIEDLAYFSVGTVTGFLSGSFVECPLHEKVLHCKDPANFSKFKFLNKFVKAASDAHDREHHPGFEPDQHYFADGTNKGIVSHFSKKDVGLIAASSAVLGLVTSQAGRLVYLSPGFSSKDIAFSSGFLACAMSYYGIYESTHHFMHFLGERRSKIGYKLGDKIQGNNPDDKLRLSIPLMTRLSNKIERN